MRQIRTSATAAIVGLAALALLATPSFAGGNHGAMNAGAPVQTTPMGQGQGDQWRGQPGTQGMTGPGMMAPGTGGQGMMVPGTGGLGMMGQGFGKGLGLDSQVVPSKDLTADDVRHFLDHRLEMHGNKRLKVSEVKEVGEDKFVADITTVDGSLVQRFEVDQHTGQMRDIE